MEHTDEISLISVMVASKEWKLGIKEAKIMSAIRKELIEKKGGDKMSQVDELDFERMRNIAEGFGWEVKQTEILGQTIKMMMEKERVEPETDITVTPT